MSWRYQDSHTKFQCSCGGARTSGERHNFQEQRKLRNLEFEAWPGFRNFRIWRISIRSEVPSCANRSIEAMIWVSEIESAKSIAELKTSYSITQAKVQTNFEVPDSEIASGLKKIINGDFKRRVFIQEEAAQGEKRSLTGRQIACMICEYFEVSDTDESASDMRENTTPD